MSLACALRNGSRALTQIAVAAALLAGTAHGQTLRSETTWGGQGADIAHGVVVGADGSSYMVGLSDSFTFDQFGQPRAAIAVVKFATDGSVVWQRVWTGNTFHGGLGGPAIALTADGQSLYVSGFTTSNGGDAVLLKFDTQGTLLWQRTWGGSQSESGSGVATDAQGAAYVAGTSTSFGPSSAGLFVVKFDADGTLAWQKILDDANGTAAGVGPDGHVYAAGGRARGGALDQSDIIALKLTSAGTLVWNVAYAAGEVVDARGGMKVGSDGAVNLAGALQARKGGGIIGIAALLVRLDANGGLLFDREWGGKNGTSGAGVAVGPDGSIHVAGQASFTDGADEAFVFRVATDGRGLDAVTWGGAGFDSGHGVGVASDGTVSLAATTTTAPPYVLLDASRKVSAVRGTVAAAAGGLADVAGVAADPALPVIIPDGRTAYSGNSETALVRYVR